MSFSFRIQLKKPGLRIHGICDMLRAFCDKPVCQRRSLNKLVFYQKIQKILVLLLTEHWFKKKYIKIRSPNPG